MRTHLTCWILMVVGGMAGPGSAAKAQPAAVPPDLVAVRDFVKTGQWQQVDLQAVAPLEDCRALLLLQHVLNELAHTATAQADLLSTYIDQQNLGAEFVDAASAPPPAQLTCANGRQIAVALLRGPMAGTSYATALGDLSANGVQSYRHLYEGTVERKWSEVTAAGRQVRNMARFLKATRRFADYQGWAAQEVERRQKQYDQDLADRRQATREKAEQKAAQQQAAELAHAQQVNEQMQAENRQMQQALVAAQQSAAQAQAQAAAPASSGEDDDAWGLNVYGAVSNLQRARWVGDAAYAGQARAATEGRMADWHGAGSGGGGGRRR